MLQLGFDSSMLQRSLHRLILDILTKGDYTLILKYSPKLFKDTLKRASLNGGRSIEQIVHDFYTNPKHKAIGLIDVLDWFKESNIAYYSSYPSIEIENLINGIHKNGGCELISKYPQLRAFSELYFMIACHDDEILFEDLNPEIHTVNKNFDELIKYHKLDDYNYGDAINPCKKRFRDYFESFTKLCNIRHEKLINKIEVFYSEILLLIDACEKGNFEVVSSAIDKFNILFKGYNGVPSNYIVGYKESNFWVVSD